MRVKRGKIEKNGGTHGRELRPPSYPALGNSSWRRKSNFVALCVTSATNVCVCLCSYYDLLYHCVYCFTCINTKNTANFESKN